MEKAKVKQTFYVDQTGTTYTEGEEVEVPKYLLERHLETGFLEEIKSDKLTKNK